VNSLVPGTIYTPFVEGYLKKHYADDLEKATDNLKSGSFQELSALLRTSSMPRSIWLKPSMSTAAA
jgi:hypothetical protein